MRAWGIVIVPAFLLAGCGGGGGEDFAVEVKRPVTAVFAPLSAADPGLARIAFPGITFERSRPSDNEILYTIPGTGSFPATIRFRLEPRNDAGAERTIVHASVDVPHVTAVVDGSTKELSEWKIERQLQTVLKATGQSLEMGSSASTQSEQLSSLLAAIAVATNEKYLARAMDIKSHPDKIAELMLAFAMPGEQQPPPSVDGRSINAVDPDSAERQREMAEREVEWDQQRAQDKASAPTSNLDRYDY